MSAINRHHLADYQQHLNWHPREGVFPINPAQALRQRGRRPEYRVPTTTGIGCFLPGQMPIAIDSADERAVRDVRRMAAQPVTPMQDSLECTDQ